MNTTIFHPKQIEMMQVIVDNPNVLDFVYEYRVSHFGITVCKDTCRDYIRTRLKRGTLETDGGRVIMNQYREAYIEYRARVVS